MSFYTYHYHRYKFFLYFLLFATFCCKVPSHNQACCLRQTQQFYLAEPNPVTDFVTISNIEKYSDLEIKFV